MGHVRSKTRSQSQISDTPYVHSRGHIFRLIIMKLSQNVCLDGISDRFKNGPCWVKTRSLVQILEKPCVCSRGHIFSPITKKLGQNVCLDEISDLFANGSGQVKNKRAMMALLSLHWLIREIPSYQTLQYLGIGLRHKTPNND